MKSAKWENQEWRKIARSERLELRSILIPFLFIKNIRRLCSVRDNSLSCSLLQQKAELSFTHRGNERSQEQAFDRRAHVNLHPARAAQSIGRVANEKSAHEGAHHSEQRNGHDVLKEGFAAARVASFENERR